MDHDVVIQRVREARHRISEQFDHDPERLVAYYMDRQQRHADRLVSEAENTTTASDGGDVGEDVLDAK
ncbi:MAG: hypothetical protein GVY18_02535 [Bacteroidetes bacterium]|jgi:hypothetical protein|nr:hypothetical protein [Bacteroidota bacterium]